MVLFETWQLANSKTSYGRYVLFSTFASGSSRRVERYAEVPDWTSGSRDTVAHGWSFLKLGNFPTRKLVMGGMYFFRHSLPARQDESNGMLRYRIGPLGAGIR